MTVRGLACLLIVTILMGSGMAPAQEVAGTWEGRYTCDGQTEGQMALELAASDGMLTGVFRFDHPDGAGSYSVVGRADAAGGIALVPQDWIERPAGFTALTLQGAIKAGGRAIEGQLIPCSTGRFLVEPVNPVQTSAQAPGRVEAAAPRSGGPFEGVWRGAVDCTANRRGKTEAYPIELHLGMDGAGVGGAGMLQIFKTRGSGAGPAFEQVFAVSGEVVDGSAVLDDLLMLDRGGAPVALRGITATLVAPGQLDGEVSLNGCKAARLTRIGDLQAVALSKGLAGLWMGGTAGETPAAVFLQVGQSEAEVQASWPATKAEIERDRLRLSILPFDIGGGRIVWTPLGLREASGIFAPDARPAKHSLSTASVFTLMPTEDGVDLRALMRPDDVAAALAGEEVPPGRGRLFQVALTRPDAAGLDAIAQGDAPPADFAGKIAGFLAEAPSREAQCRVLDNWLAVDVARVDIMALSVDDALQRLAGALDDARFVPVFGMPFLLTTQEERRSVGVFIRESCRGRVNAGVSFVGDFVLMSDHQFAKLTAQVANRTETFAWLAAAQAQLPLLPVDAASRKALEQLRREADRRRSEMLPEERTALLGQIERRDEEIRAGLLRLNLDGLSDDGFVRGDLGRVLAVVDRAQGLPPDLYQPLVAAAEEKAAHILAGPLAGAAAVIPSIDTSLAGLARAQAALAPFAPYRAEMEKAFGSLDPTGTLRGLHRRIEELRDDPGVQQAFAEALSDIAAQGEARAAVLSAAAPYIAEEELIHAPAFAEILDHAILQAEIRQVELIDRSTPVSPNEPTVIDIATLALQRVRAANEDILRKEEVCLSGNFSDPVTALGCLSVPALLSGKKGQFGVVLLEVQKIGCTEEVTDTRFVCLFTQTVDMNLPAGLDLGVNVAALTSNEVLDAMFLRDAEGDWQVVYGELDD